MKRKHRTALRIDISPQWKIESIMKFMSDVSFYCPRGYKYTIDGSILGDCIFRIGKEYPNKSIYCFTIKDIFLYEKKS